MDALDFSDARPSVADFANTGIAHCLVYTGNSRPDQAYLDGLRAAGITVTFIQETYSTRSREGYQAGVLDCEFAEARARERGHTGSIAVVVSDGSWSDTWDASQYGAGWASVATLPFFSYGATPICASFNAGSGRSLGSWEPETWGTGSLLTQVVGSSPVAGTDLNHIHDLAYTGLTPVPPPIGDDTMRVIQDSRGIYLLTANGVIGIDTAQRATDLATMLGQPGDKPVMLPDADVDWLRAYVKGVGYAGSTSVPTKVTSTVTSTLS